MKKVVSLFVAPIMAFTMGPVVSVRAESDEFLNTFRKIDYCIEHPDICATLATQAIQAIQAKENEIIEAIDMIDVCVGHPKICAYGMIGAIKNMLDDNVLPEIVSILETVKSTNYAPVFDYEGLLNDKYGVLTDRDKDLVKVLANAPVLTELINKDKVDFSQICDIVRNIVRKVADTHSSNEDEKVD